MSRRRYARQFAEGPVAPAASASPAPTRDATADRPSALAARLLATGQRVAAPPSAPNELPARVGAARAWSAAEVRALGRAAGNRVADRRLRDGSWPATAAPADGAIARFLRVQRNGDGPTTTAPTTAPPSTSTPTAAPSLDWANAAVTFRTHNDRYTSTPVEVEKRAYVYTYVSGAAVRDIWDLTTAHDVRQVQGSGLNIYASRELAALLTGDSVYTVTANAYERYAPVNLVAHPEQVRFSASRRFCYLPPGSEVYDAVMHSSDSDTLVTGVESNAVVFSISGRTYRARITPQNGDFPFDFDYNASAGTISHGHPGHALYGLG